MNCAKVRPHLGDHLEGDLELTTRAQINEHLSDCASCTSELRELRSTVAHIRSLPTPDPPADLVNQVIRRIEAGEARPQAFPAAIRRLLDPVWVAPLAAGIAGFALLSGMEIEFVEPPEVIATAPRGAQFASQKEIDMWTAQPPTLARNEVISPRLTAIERSAARRFYRPDPVAGVAGLYGRLDPDSQQLDLDDQLDRAKRNPGAFLRRLNAVTELERRSTIAPLVVRSTRRGDAHLVAKRLRASSHPLATSVSAQFDRQHDRKRRLPTDTPLVVPVSSH